MSVQQEIRFLLSQRQNISIYYLLFKQKPSEAKRKTKTKARLNQPGSNHKVRHLNNVREHIKENQKE